MTENVVFGDTFENNVTTIIELIKNQENGTPEVEAVGDAMLMIETAAKLEKAIADGAHPILLNVLSAQLGTLQALFSAKPVRKQYGSAYANVYNRTASEIINMSGKTPRVDGKLPPFYLRKLAACHIIRSRLNTSSSVLSNFPLIEQIGLTIPPATLPPMPNKTQ